MAEFLVSLLPMTLLNEGKILNFDPGVCGVNPSWVISWQGKEYLLIKRIACKCPEYPQGAVKVSYFEIYIKNENGKWEELRF